MTAKNMKQIIFILLLFLTVNVVAQNTTGKQYIPWLKSDAITIPGPADDAKQKGYFIWHGDTIDFSMLTDSTIVYEQDSTVLFVTLKQLIDSLNSLPGGHSPVTIGANGTTAGLTVTGQELNMKSATAARNGYITSMDFSYFYNKLSSVAHNYTLTGSGTSIDPLKADTAIMAAKLWVLNRNYINENQLHWDSITNKPTIPTIEHNAFDGTWDGDLDGTDKNTIYDVISALPGGHDAVTLSDSALLGGLSLSTQILDFQRATASQNGFLTYTDWISFNAYKNDSAGLLRWSDTLDTRKGIATPYDLTIGLATKEPTLTKGNLTENITGLQFSATRQVIGGAAELQLSSGYSIPANSDTVKWGQGYSNQVVSAAVTGAITKTITLTQRDGGTVSTTFTDINSSAASSFKFFSGSVTARNIDVTYTGYTPSNGDQLVVLPDYSIAEGDTITLSINSGTQYNIFEKTSCVDSLAMTLVFRNDVWYLLGSVGEEYVATGTNTGDQVDTLFTTIAISDETTDLTTGTAKRTFRMPVGCTLIKVRANVVTAPTGATLIFDINEDGNSVLSTKLSIDAGEKTSKTASSAAVFSDTSIADDAEITIDIDQIGSTIAGTGAKVVLYYVKN